MNKFIINIVVFIVFKSICYSQQKVDTTLAKINKQFHDTVNARILYADADELSKIDPSLSITYLNKALKFAQNNNSKIILSDIYNKLGYCYYFTNEYSLSLKNFILALEYCEKLNNPSGIAACYNNIGSIYLDIKDTTNALRNHLKSLEIRKTLKPVDETVKGQISMSYGNIGKTYFTMGRLSKAMDYYKMSLKISKEIGNKNREALMLNNMGSIYGEQKNYAEAFRYFSEAYVIYKQLNSKENSALCLNNIAEINFRTRRYFKAIESYNASLEISSEISGLSDMETSYTGLYNCYLQMKDYKQAHNYLVLSNSIHDSIFSEENTSELNNLKAKFDANSREKEIKLLTADKALKDIKIRNANIVTYASISGILILSAFVFYVFYLLKQKQKINQELNSKNEKIEYAYQLVDAKQKEILDSINYAKRIQNGLIANKKELTKYFPNNFIYYNPKDIVSGDFSWTNYSKNESNEELFYLACCDSTGHGVPGAFMSLLNMSLLSEAINEKKIFEPNLVFNHIRLRLVDLIGAEGQQDGFDGTLLCLNLSNKKITYASSNNGGLLVKPDGSFEELSYDKMPVGKGEKENSFLLYELNYSQGDSVYLYTDGFADQFGGPKGKKFKYNQFIATLINVSTLPIDKQQKELELIFNNWQSNHEQVDDVEVIGIVC